MCVFRWFEWFFTKAIQIWEIQSNVCNIFFDSDLKLSRMKIRTNWGQNWPNCTLWIVVYNKKASELLFLKYVVSALDFIVLVSTDGLSLLPCQIFKPFRALCLLLCCNFIDVTSVPTDGHCRRVHGLLFCKHRAF